jgi:hypothetical protein
MNNTDQATPELTPREIRRRRIATALAVSRVSLKDIWRHVEKDGPVCSYNMVQKIAAGAEGDSEIGAKIRAAIAELTGQPAAALFDVDEKAST